MGFQRVLIAVDDSPIAAHAADTGIDIAHSMGAEVGFIYVRDAKRMNAPESGISAGEFAVWAEQEGKRLVAGFCRRMAPPSTALEFVEVGQPAAKIVEAAKQWPASLIVIGSHGRTGITRILLGSIAEGVIRHAPCPVLVVKAKD